ncbi:hypothetical protein AXF42_Ash015233 [Apostasia shenzhenica]|uniref:Uncharacterized protein n=1 Tax=Apostasia shenzhenica TaxID=1088818 RepID=A0A2I0AQN1_9ASPA|nr:hypothetical protein AXF42_Ash015233 [Apostasia shenzhenica]
MRRKMDSFDVIAEVERRGNEKRWGHVGGGRNFVVICVQLRFAPLPFPKP